MDISLRLDPSEQPLRAGIQYNKYKLKERQGAKLKFL